MQYLADAQSASTAIKGCREVHLLLLANLVLHGHRVSSLCKAPPSAQHIFSVSISLCQTRARFQEYLKSVAMQKVADIFQGNFRSLEPCSWLVLYTPGTR